MAWNEPGNNSNDPWGNKNRNDGPPDIDEAIKKLQERFSGIFGGGGGAGSFGFILGIALVLGLIVWGIKGVYIVEEGWQTVILRFGAYHETNGPGLHWNPPIMDDVIMVQVEKSRFVEIGYSTRTGRAQPVAKEALMLTQDENIIDVQLAVQYRISDTKEFVLNVREPEVTLKDVTESVLREIVGKRKMDFVLTDGRVEVALAIRDLIQNMLNQYGAGLKIDSINFQGVQPPEQVRDAFEDAIKAREDRERYINQANAYLNEIVPQANGEAARITEEAAAYKAKVTAEAKGDAERFSTLYAEYKKAPAITRKRLYLDAVESVLGSSTKIIMDTKGGNNIMYLPLDKMINGLPSVRYEGSSSNDRSYNRNTTSASDVPGSTTTDPRRRREIR